VKKAKTEPAPVAVDGNLSKGAALLAKMGWSGGGVGKHGTGITVALEVKSRPANAGLGMIQEKTEAQKKVERQRRGEEESSDEEEAAAVVPASGSGKKVDRSQTWRKTGKRVQVKSAYDVLKEEADEPADAKMTIIDLTGEKERVTDVKSLTAYEKDRAATNYKIGLGINFVFFFVFVLFLIVLFLHRQRDALQLGQTCRHGRSRAETEQSC
jgi:hypothetical protein